MCRETINRESESGSGVEVATIMSTILLQVLIRAEAGL